MQTSAASHSAPRHAERSQARAERGSDHRLLALRWLVLLAFPVGYSLTYSQFTEFTYNYLVLTVLAFLACGVILWQLKPPVQPDLPIWLFLCFFMVGYYVQFYWMLAQPGIIWETLASRYPWSVESPELLMEAFATTTYAFVSFAAASTMISIVKAFFPQLVPWSWRPGNAPVSRAMLMPLLLISLLLTPITAFVVARTGIAQMGGEQVYLPYRMAGVIFWTRVAIMPAMLLMLIYVGVRTGSRGYLVLGIFLLVFNGILDIFLRASRGGLVWPFVQLGALSLLLGMVSRRVLLIGLVVVLAVIIFWPAMTYYRAGRSLMDLSFIDSLAFGFSAFSPEDASTWDVIIRAGRSMFFRAIDGMQLLVPTLASGISSEGMTVLTDQPAVFFTRTILGFAHQEYSQFSPGLLGVLYMGGGNHWVVAGIFLITVISWSLWLLFGAWRIPSRPVAQTLLIILIAGLFGGEFNSLPRYFFLLAASIGVIETIRLMTRG